MLDREIRSWPSIDFEENPNGIGGSNGAQITGIGDDRRGEGPRARAPDGRLPVTFPTLEQTAISATLGEDSLAEAWRAAIAGLLVVAIFLLDLLPLPRRRRGASGSAIYAAFLYAAILIFNVTLTLPGFAGMILTLGVAADANIVIFERIKEEARAGKSVRAAIAAGYARASRRSSTRTSSPRSRPSSSSCVATAGVKGFALMLLIGPLISLLTAVAATRAMLGLLAGFKLVRQPEVHGRRSARDPPKWSDATSSASGGSGSRSPASLIALSLGALVVKGLNLGIDFEGGTQITFTTAAAGRARGRARAGGRASARATPRSRAAARRSGEQQLQRVPDPDGGARQDEQRG